MEQGTGTCLGIVGQLTEKCLYTMTGMEKDHECWNQAFELFKELVSDMKSERPDGKIELYQVDDITNFEYDVQGWMDDYLDKLDMNSEYDQLLEMFCWKEDNPSDIKFQKVSALDSLGRNDEAASKYYQAAGKKKEKKRIDQAIEAYEKFLEEFWMSGDEEEDELPF